MKKKLAATLTIAAACVVAAPAEAHCPSYCHPTGWTNYTPTQVRTQLWMDPNVTIGQPAMRRLAAGHLAYFERIVANAVWFQGWEDSHTAHVYVKSTQAVWADYSVHPLVPERDHGCKVRINPGSSTARMQAVCRPGYWQP